MATLRRGLVDKVKKAAEKVSTRGVQVAAKAGTRGARALVETTVAAVKTVDKLQEKLGRRPAKAPVAEEPMADIQASAAEMPKATPKASAAKAQKTSGAKARTASPVPKARRTTADSEASPVMLREAGRKTMPTAAPKRSKAAAAPGFKVKRGQKHRHTGR
ncbi:MAG: hypothetical protein ACJ8AT_21975 [Hyalangium sp.]|uniref:hypothetical protein n=1 Tax=Hyalangium sp. TaxID=2028555 RepID=UPI003899E9E9